jgi:ATP-dependent exoDNAse (exonuclease V) beta subunit
MTIHKSKGLGFPMVIAVLKEWRQPRVGPVPWEQEEGVELVRTTDGRERNELLAALHADANLREKADGLNRLYVALTRAAHELHVVVVGNNADAPPASIVPEMSSSPRRPLRVIAATTRPPVARRVFACRAADVPDVQIRRLRDKETHRGEAFHAVLARLGIITDLERQVREAIEAEQAADRWTDVRDVKERLLPFLSSPDVAPWFVPHPGRRVVCEVDVASASGDLFRIDRLIVDPERVIVVDYKTGGGEMERAYREQVQGYLSLCAGLYPDRPRIGYIAYIDRRERVEVL